MLSDAATGSDNEDRKEALNHLIKIVRELNEGEPVDAN